MCVSNLIHKKFVKERIVKRLSLKLLNKIKLVLNKIENNDVKIIQVNIRVGFGKPFFFSSIKTPAGGKIIVINN